MLKNLLEITRTRLTRRPARSGSRAWSWVTVTIALLVSIPILSVISNVFFASSGDIWGHLAATVLPGYVRNSLLLMVGVGTGVLVIGVGTAWLVTMCSFPGSRHFQWLLILPMAMPAYLLAYTYTDLLAFEGPVQGYLRAVTGWGAADYWFPEIRSIEGAIVLMSLVFFPYVYLLTRTAFLEQSISLLEAGRSLGSSPTACFYRIALPLARPSIAAGMALALMETLNDFGTVDYFGVQTFTTGIYRTWFGLGERVAAAQLSAFLMLFILVLILLEQWSRKNMYTRQSTAGRYKRIKLFKLTGWKAWASTAFCSVPVVFGFLVPVVILVNMLVANFGSAVNTRILGLMGNTFILATIGGVVTVLVAMVLAYGNRRRSGRLIQSATKIGTMGYAIPGTVIAVGILIPFGWLDNFIDGKSRELFGFSTGLLFSGTVFALVFAYLVRFLAVAFNTVESSLNKITPNMDEAAWGMGYSFTKVLRKVHIPMLSGSLFAAIMLVVVDIIKELPATLIIRPFNFDTLAIQVYRLASDERLAESSGAALAIVLVGLIPVIILSRSIARSRQTDEE